MEAPIPSEMEAPGLGLPPQKKIGGAAAGVFGVSSDKELSTQNIQFCIR